jgi:hypothetical protein
MLIFTKKNWENSMLYSLDDLEHGNWNKIVFLMTVDSSKAFIINPSGLYYKQIMIVIWQLLWWVGNCDIDFINFCHCQVEYFKISNLSKRLKFFGQLSKELKLKPKLTKYIKTEWKQSNIQWNFVNLH